MRGFKFRGKSLVTGDWVYGNLIVKTDAYGKVIQAFINNRISGVKYEREYPESNLIICHPVDSKTVGQYTGLKDKNGKEIYERDIVKIEDGLTGIEFVGVVAFENGSFIVHDGNRVGYRWLDYDREILGNICENPELLGVMK